MNCATSLRREVVILHADASQSRHCLGAAANALPVLSFAQQQRVSPARIGFLPLGSPELVINLKFARALGVWVLQSPILRADDVMCPDD